jgi:hypothetical protein
VLVISVLKFFGEASSKEKHENSGQSKYPHDDGLVSVASLVLIITFNGYKKTSD